jgi:hypothetical protein
MFSAKSVLCDAYLKACKQRDYATHKLWVMQNSDVAIQERKLVHKALVTNPRDKQGWVAWARYIRSLNNKQRALKRQHAHYKDVASTLNKVLRMIRTKKI